MADGPDLNLATGLSIGSMIARRGSRVAARRRRLGHNRLDIFAMGTDSALWHRWWG